MNPKLKNKVFLDFETKSAIGIDNGAFAYAAHESSDILLTGYCIEDRDYVVSDMQDLSQLQPLYRAIEAGYIVVAHNFLFEIAVVKYIGPKYNWPKMRLGQWRCTMQMAGRAGLPLSLGECAKALKIGEKLESGNALIKLFSIPQKDGRHISMDSRPREKEQFMEYCGIDNVVCREIYLNLPEWTESELSDVMLDLKSNLHGVPVDVQASKIIYNNVVKEQAGFATRVSDLTGGVITKMTQVQRVKKWAQQNVNSEIMSCDAENLQLILEGKFGDVDDVTKEILEMRQHASKSSTGKYIRYIHSSIDGSVHGMIISFGAHTGRGISKLLNLYNLPKPSIKYDSMDELVTDLKEEKVDINEKYGSYLKAASTAIRGMITAPKGKKLTVSDYAAIEARIVFWLAGCKRGLQKYVDGIDNYIDMATFIYSKPYASITDDERWLGKQVILGAGFGLGGQGFVNSCERWGVTVAKDLADEAIQAYRETYPEVVDLWNDLENGAMKACKTGKVVYAAHGRIAFKTNKTPSGVIMLRMKLPSGRCITYPDVSIQVVKTPWGAKKKAVVYKKAKNGGFYPDSTYGGKLAENAVQAIARDIFYYGCKQAQAAGYQILFGVYDEVIGLNDADKVNIEEFNELICRQPDWSKGLPLLAEGKIMKHYQKI